jgi:predicted nucleic acid-binding Zn ribbon protein
MPKYIIVCPKCGKQKEVFCMVSERNAHTCLCGGRMKVKITTANFHNRLKFKQKVNEWMKERGF